MLWVEEKSRNQEKEVKREEKEACQGPRNAMGRGEKERKTMIFLRN